MVHTLAPLLYYDEEVANLPMAHGQGVRSRKTQELAADQFDDTVVLAGEMQ